MQAEGRHILGELNGCNSHLLNDTNKLKSIIKKLGKVYKLDIREVLTQFEPYGITLVSIIGKSHISLHTYPEEKHVSVDVFTCSGNPMPIFKAIKNIFKPSSSTFCEVLRNRNIKIINSDWISGDEQPVEGYRDEYHIKEKILSLKSKYQNILVIDNESFGKMLFLDGELQISEKGQHVYDSCLVNCIKPKDRLKIKRGFVFGGGDGGITNQALKTLSNIESIDLVEIDKEVVEVCKKYFSGICGIAFTDSRTNLVIKDAFGYLDECIEHNITFDVMFVDLTDIANRQLNITLDNTLEKILKCLNQNGYLIMQAGSCYDVNSQSIIKNAIMNKFRNVKERKVWIPSYGSMWSFVSAIK